MVLAMKFLEMLHPQPSRQLRQFHVFINRHPEEPDLYRTQLPTDGEGFLLAAMCNADDVAVAVLAKVPMTAALPEGEALSRRSLLLAEAQRAAGVWASTLGVVLSCEPRRIEWMVMESRETAFAATSALAQGPWVPLQDLSERGRSTWEQFTDVYPEFIGLARGRLKTWMLGLEAPSRAPGELSP
jgi:hypothetical protein